VRQSPQPVLARPILVQAAMAAQAPAPRTLGLADSRAAGPMAVSPQERHRLGRRYFATPAYPSLLAMIRRPRRRMTSET